MVRDKLQCVVAVDAGEVQLIYMEIVLTGDETVILRSAKGVT
jgi:hypothetical protein